MSESVDSKSARTDDLAPLVGTGKAGVPFLSWLGGVAGARSSMAEHLATNDALDDVISRAGLLPREWDAIVLSFGKGFSDREAAAILGVSRASVSQDRKNALKKLQHAGADQNFKSRHPSFGNAQMFYGGVLSGVLRRTAPSGESRCFRLLRRMHAEKICRDTALSVKDMQKMWDCDYKDLKDLLFFGLIKNDKRNTVDRAHVNHYYLDERVAQLSNLGELFAILSPPGKQAYGFYWQKRGLLDAFFETYAPDAGVPAAAESARVPQNGTSVNAGDGLPLIPPPIELTTKREETLARIEAMSPGALTADDCALLAKLAAFFHYKSPGDFEAPEEHSSSVSRAIACFIFLVKHFDPAVFQREIPLDLQNGYMGAATTLDDAAFNHQLSHFAYPHRMLEVIYYSDKNINGLSALIEEGAPVVANLAEMRQLFERFFYYNNPYISAFMFNLTEKYFDEMLTFNEKCMAFLEKIEADKGNLYDSFGINLGLTKQYVDENNQVLGRIKDWKAGKFSKGEKDISVKKFVGIIRKNISAAMVDKAASDFDFEETEDVDESDMVNISMGDAYYLTQNLLSNALAAKDAMRPFRIRLKISHETIEEKKYLTVEFSDTGKGMPEDILAHVRDGGGRTTKGEFGSGQGVPIIFAIAKRAGGWVEVNSEEGKGLPGEAPGRAQVSAKSGTTFIVRLPITDRVQVTETLPNGSSDGGMGLSPDGTSANTSANMSAPAAGTGLPPDGAPASAMADFLANERARTIEFCNTVNLIYGAKTHGIKIPGIKEELVPDMIAVGKSWMKGYEKGNNQFCALNPLVSFLINYCDERNIPLVIGDDDALPGLIADKKNEKNMRSDARVLVLAGAAEDQDDKEVKILSEAIKMLMQDKAYTIVGVDGKNLDGSYIGIVEILNLALQISMGYKLEGDTILPPTNDRRYYIIIPNARPMDYKKLQIVYSVQRDA